MWPHPILRTILVVTILFAAHGVRTGLAEAKSAADFTADADKLRVAGKDDDAIAAYEKALSADKDHLPAYSGLSMIQLARAQFKLARELLEKATKAHPGFAGGWYNLAFAYRKLGQHDFSLQAYRKYTELEPKRADPYWGIGLVLQAKGDERGAAASFRRYAKLETDPKKWQWVQRALKVADELDAKLKGPAATAGREQPVAAASSAPARSAATAASSAGTPAKTPSGTSFDLPLPASADANPSSAEGSRAKSLVEQGMAQAAQGRHGRALSVFQDAVAADFSYRQIYRPYSMSFFATGNYDGAVRMLRNAIRDIPEFAELWQLYGFALRQAKRHDEALAAHKMYLKKATDRSSLALGHYGLALVYRDLGQTAAAVRGFNDYLGLEQDKSRARWTDQATAQVRALGGTPTTPGSATMQGQAVATSRGTSAPRAARPSLDVPPQAKVLSKAERRKLAREEARRQQAEARAKRLEARQRKAQEAKDRRAEGKRKREEVALRQAEARRIQREDAAPGKPAVVATRTGKKRGPKTPLALESIATPRSSGAASTLAQNPLLGTKATAIGTDLRPIPAPGPSAAQNDSAAEKQRVQADTLARAGKCAEALPLYQQAAKGDPLQTRAFDGIAYCAFVGKTPAAGISALTIALRDNPDYHRGWLHMARLQQLEGRHFAAAGLYRKYLRKEPNDQDARFELARALAAAGNKDQALAAYRDYLERERREDRAPMFAAARVEYQRLGGQLPAPAGTAGSVELVAKAAAPSAGRVAKASAGRSVVPVAAKSARLMSAKERRAEAKRKRAEERTRKLAEVKRKRLAAKETARKKLETARLKRVARKRGVSVADATDAAEDARIAKLEAKGKKAAAPSPATKAKIVKTAKASERLAKAVARDIGEGSQRPPRDGPIDVLEPAPEAAQGLVGVADKLFASGNYVAALGVYLQAAELDPASSEVLYKAGVTAVALRRMDRAADLFRRVLSINPNNQSAAINLRLAKAAASGKRPTAAYLEQALATVAAHLRRGRYALAEQALDDLIEKALLPRAFQMRADARLALQQPRSALRDGGRALALDPNLADALRVIGDAHRQLNQLEKARYYYRLYLTRTENDLAAHQTRESVKTALAEL
jgi:tetratricopeptide (TPR) repeat protein